MSQTKHVLFHCPDNRPITYALPATGGSSCHSLDVGRICLSFGMDAQKKNVRPSEQNPQARQIWQQSLVHVQAHDHVFLDECGSNIALVTVYGRAPRGRRAWGVVPENRGKTTILGT